MYIYYTMRKIETAPIFFCRDGRRVKITPAIYLVINETKSAKNKQNIHFPFLELAEDAENE